MDDGVVKTVSKLDMSTGLRMLGLNGVDLLLHEALRKLISSALFTLRRCVRGWHDVLPAMNGGGHQEVVGTSMRRKKTWTWLSSRWSEPVFCSPAGRWRSLLTTWMVLTAVRPSITLPAKRLDMAAAWEAGQ
jgi:hypothetical protein